MLALMRWLSIRNDRLIVPPAQSAKLRNLSPLPREFAGRATGSVLDICSDSLSWLIHLFIRRVNLTINNTYQGFARPIKNAYIKVLRDLSKNWGTSWPQFWLISIQQYPSQGLANGRFFLPCLLSKCHVRASGSSSFQLVICWMSVVIDSARRDLSIGEEMEGDE